MTGEEYFKRVAELKKEIGTNKPNTDGFNGYIPVLHSLKEKENGMTAGEIAEQFYISTARVAKMINSLEEKGYVERKKGENDKRITIVMITDLGIKFLDGFVSEKVKEVGLAIKDIPDSDMEIFFNVTEKLLRNLCKNRKC